jgi:hypothetical protein
LQSWDLYASLNSVVTRVRTQPLDHFITVCVADSLHLQTETYLSMSCTPDQSYYTNRSLSPSDESRFVPRQSISIMECHFPSTPPATPQPPKLNRDEPKLVDDDEKSGIVGATICFTPQASPPGSPGATPAPLMGSVETEEYIGSIVALAKDEKDKSSTTDDAADYELLDRIDSDSLKVEDLDVDDEEVVDDILKGTATAMKTGSLSDDEAMNKLMKSPPSSVPSLSNDEAAASADDKKPPAPPALNEEGLLYSDDSTAFSKMTKSMLSHMANLGKQDAASIEGDTSNPSSPKVDATPISTLATLKVFWENRVLGKAAREIEVANIDDANTLDASDHKSVSNSIATSQDAVWLWVQSLALICAYSSKKFMERICGALARNIISTAAGPNSGSNDDEPSDEIDLEEIVGSTRVNLGSIFGESDAKGDAANDEADNSTIDEGSSQVDWKSRASRVVVVLLFLLSLLFHPFGPRSSSDSNDSDDHVCLSNNTTSFESIPVWEVDVVQTDASHIEVYTSFNLPGLAFIATLIIAMVSAYSYNPDLMRKLSIKREFTHRTGIWTAVEHEQFIKGFDKYGSNWKLVAPFIPTRNYEQVKAHGIHWKKIGSPDTMKRSKKVKIETSDMPISIVSTALAQLTPKTSNIACTFIKKDPPSKSKEEQLAKAREYAQTLKKTQSAKKEVEATNKRPSRYSM